MEKAYSELESRYHFILQQNKAYAKALTELKSDYDKTIQQKDDIILTLYKKLEESENTKI